MILLKFNTNSNLHKAQKLKPSTKLTCSSVLTCTSFGILSFLSSISFPPWCQHNSILAESKAIKYHGQNINSLKTFPYSLIVSFISHTCISKYNAKSFIYSSFYSCIWVQTFIIQIQQSNHTQKCKKKNNSKYWYWENSTEKEENNMVKQM